MNLILFPYAVSASKQIVGRGGTFEQRTKFKNCSALFFSILSYQMSHNHTSSQWLRKSTINCFSLFMNFPVQCQDVCKLWENRTKFKNCSMLSNFTKCQTSLLPVLKSALNNSNTSQYGIYLFFWSIITEVCLYCYRHMNRMINFNYALCSFDYCGVPSTYRHVESTLSTSFLVSMSLVPRT